MVGRRYAESSSSSSVHANQPSAEHEKGIKTKSCLRTLMALAHRHDDREWVALPVTGEVHLAGQSSLTVADCFVRGMKAPYLRLHGLGLRRASAACW